MFKQFCIISLLSIFSLNAISHNCENDDLPRWQKTTEFERVYPMFEEIFECISSKEDGQLTLSDTTTCYTFAALAMDTIYNDVSFKLNNEYMTSSQIATALMNNQIPGWLQLGPASEQSNIDDAVKLVENGSPVVSVWQTSKGNGFVNVLLPGGTLYSGAWGLQVPNTANLNAEDLPNAFLGCRLSFAFSADKKETVYLFSKSES